MAHNFLKIFKLDNDDSARTNSTDVKRVSTWNSDNKLKGT